MRFCGLLCFLFALAGFSAAQDSNFSVGPQYLTNYGSPMFLRPIATPTLSLGEGSPARLAAEEGSGTQFYPGTWNSISVTAASLTSGTAYWIAILGTTGKNGLNALR